LSIDLTNQGGGIGKASVYVDDIRIIEDARSDRDSSKNELTINIDLARYNKFFRTDTANVIKVVAWNAEGYLSSRPDTIHYTLKSTGMKGEGAGKPAGEKETKTPRFYGLIIGTSDYSGSKVDLTYAAKDAMAFGNALKLGASRLFGAGNVRIRILATGEKENEPTHARILQEFDSLARAKPEDIIVVYLSGHGVNHGGQDGLFYYLTMEADGNDATYLNDPQIKKSRALSSQDFADCLNRIASRKKVLILDACSSGQAANDLLASLAKEIPSSQKRALEFTQEATGSYIIASSATHSASFESTRYGHGLMTYALLKGMRGAELEKIEESDFIDVEQLFLYTRREVPELAKDINRIQEPIVRTPGNSGRLIIGLMNEQDKKSIPLENPKAIILPSKFMNLALMENDLQIEERLNAQLDKIASKGSDHDLEYVKGGNYPDAYQVIGTYSINAGIISISYVIRKGGIATGKPFEENEKTEKLDDLINRITDNVLQNIK
jgi:hypothetical protein